MVFRARHAVPLRIAALLILLLLAGCGNKGPVRPKLLPLPAAPAPVTLEQRGEAFLVSWHIPKVNQDGSPLTGLQGFRVYRMPYRPGEDCPGCRDDFTLLRTVDLDYLQEVRREDERLFWWDEQVRPDFGYVYQVVAMTAGGRAGAPGEARRLFVAPPPAPQELRAAGFDHLVRLQWRAPAELSRRIRRLRRLPPHNGHSPLPAADQPETSGRGRLRGLRRRERPHLPVQRHPGGPRAGLPGAERAERDGRGCAAGRPITAGERRPGVQGGGRPAAGFFDFVRPVC